MINGPQKPKRSSRRFKMKAFRFFFFLMIEAAALLLGTESSLILKRSPNGPVSAENSWRFAGKWNLFSRSVANVREVKMQSVSLTEKDARSTAYRDIFGMRITPEEVVLVGETRLSYPYREDLSLIRTFLKNPFSVYVMGGTIS